MVEPVLRLSMNDNSLSSLKRKPLKKSSQQIVESVLSATRQILNSEPVESISTNRISKSAGVGIGSLYEYFKSKQSIFSALIEKEIQENIDAFEAGLRKLTGQPISKQLDWALGEFFIHVTNKRIFLHKLLQAVSRDFIIEKTHASRVEIARILIEHLKQHSGEINSEGLDQKIYFIVNLYTDSLQTAIHIQQGRANPFQWGPEKSQYWLRKVVDSLLLPEEKK